MKTMKSPAKIGENRFLGNITTSSFRNLLPRSIYTKQKTIQNSDTKSFRSNDENAPPCDPNIQTTQNLNNNNNNNNNDLALKKKSPQKVFPSATQILPQNSNQFEVKSVLVTRTQSMANEITEEDDSLADQIRELKEELIRTKSDGCKLDGSKSGYFRRESLSQLRNSINKSSVMSCANKEGSEKETIYEDDDDGDVMELSKQINKFHNYCETDDIRDSIQSSFASASGCEAESMSGDEICSVDKHKGHRDCAVANSNASTVGNGISISLPHQTRILEEPPLSESPKIRNTRKSVAASTKFQAIPRNVTESSNIGNANVEQFGPSMSKKHLSPTDSLAASLHRGLHIIDCHQRNSLSNRSSVSFSFGHLSLKPSDDADRFSASVKSLKADRPKEGGGSSILLCLSCREKLDQKAEGGYTSTEEACLDEKDLKNLCQEQAAKIEQLTCLLDQYKKNTVQESDKLMKSDDGVNETEEVLKETYETNEEFGKVRIDLSEKEALLKEIAELKTKLQPAKSTDNLRSSLLLRSFQMRKSIDVTKSTENNNDVLEQERERWTEMESEWISLTDDLRMDIDSHRRHAEDLEMKLKKEKMATEELNDAINRAMAGHSRFIEQYTELQEKYDELAERHSVTMAGIVDVKKAAAKAALKGRHGKRFAKAFSAELTAIRAEKEREREFLKKENKGLKIQLRDTVEAVQAAGELLVRLREAEQAVQSSEERFSLIKEENDKLKKQMEKLKSKHKTEMSTMKQYLAESKLPGSALEPWFKENEQEEEEQVSEHKTGVVRYNDYTEDQAWRAEFGAIYQHHDHY